MRKPITILLTFLFASFLAAGCGQKGPLFLPGDPSEIREAAQQASDTDEDEERDRIINLRKEP